MARCSCSGREREAKGKQPKAGRKARRMASVEELRRTRRENEKGKKGATGCGDPSLYTVWGRDPSEGIGLRGDAQDHIYSRPLTPSVS